MYKCNIGKLFFVTFLIVLCSNFISINQSEARPKIPLTEQTPFEFNKQLVRYLTIHNDSFPTKLNHPPISKGKSRNGLYNVYAATFTKNNVEGEIIYLTNKDGDIEGLIIDCAKKDINKNILTDVVVITTLALGLQKEEGDILFNKIKKPVPVAKAYCHLLRRIICIKPYYDKDDDRIWFMFYAEPMPENKRSQ